LPIRRACSPIVEIAVAGYVLVKAMALLRRRLLSWHPEASASPAA
jgi:NitT/TauT family transport system permease protein